MSDCKISASAVDEDERYVSCFSRFFSRGNNQGIRASVPKFELRENRFITPEEATT
jgi:hypothetical protein